MKKLIYLASLLAIVAGCAKENIPTENEGKKGNYTLLADFADPTKTTISDDGHMKWSVGDKISVLDNSGNKAEFTLAGTEATATGTFNGTFEGTPSYAVYPYNADNAIAEGVVNVVLPASYDYDGTSTHAPMVASIESTTDVTSGTAKFHHIGGLIKVTYENVPATATKFVLSATNKEITGTFAVTSDKISAKEGSSNNTVTYNLTNAGGTMTFYVPLPCGNYEFKVALYAGDTKIAKSGKKATAEISAGTYFIAPTITLPKVITINTANSGVTGSYADKDFVVDAITFHFTQWMKSTNIQAKKSTTNSCYNVDALPGKITKITIVQTGTARAIEIFGGTSAKPTDTITQPSTAAEMVYDFSGTNYSYFSMTTPGNACYITSITIECADNSGDPVTPTVAAPTFSLEENTYVGTQSLELSTTVTDGTIYYTTDNTDPSESTTAIEYTGAISLTKTTTIKAVVMDGDANFSDVVSKTYTIEASIANTEETAYSTAEAIKLINTGSSQLTSTEVYVKGTVSQVVSYNSTYKSITYWLDDNAFEVYGGLAKEGEEFSSINDIKVGASVVVKGLITVYNSVYEFKQNNHLVSYSAPAASKDNATITLGTYKKSLAVNATDSYTITSNSDGALSVTSSNTSVATVSVADGTVTVNAVSAGTATITITSAETDNYYSKEFTYTLTVTASASIPFSFSANGIASNAGIATITFPTGMSYDKSISATNYKCYSNLVGLRAVNCAYIINVDSAATTVSFTVKQNPNSGTNGNTMAVAGSVDGTNYTDIQSFTTTANSTITCTTTNTIDSSYRYFKIYLKAKDNGNCGIGSINIE